MVIICLSFFILDSKCIKGEESTVDIKGNDKHPKVKENLRDIIILHSDEDNYNVTEYRGHLKALAEEFGYYDITVESFSNVFPLSKNIQLQDVLKHCKFLFFYVSRSSFVSTVEIHGLNKEEIISVLNMPHKFDMYPSIKTVRATKSSDLKLMEIDLDYSYYKSDKKVRESYRDTLNQVFERLKK